MKVAIIHPWLPQYRKAFFEQLVKKAATCGIDVKIYYGAPPPEWSDRKDTAFVEEFIELPTRFIKVGNKNLNYKSIKFLKKDGPFDLIILEQAVRNLETYFLLLSRLPVAFWGHGKTYTLGISKTQEKLKQSLTRKGRWFFAYTPGGAKAVINAGFPPERTTIVQNSIDTSELQEHLSEVDAQKLEEFTKKYDLRDKTALFIGGLDSTKRIDFLLESAQIAHRLEPDFRLLIAGTGSDLHLVTAAAEQLSFIIPLGPLWGTDKATAIRAAKVIAMPGRVGLVAVDSFIARTPIITTDWAWHAPEFDYLQFGVNALITKNEEETFANCLVKVLNDEKQLSRLRAGCEISSEKYTIDAMVENFILGLKQALET